MQPPASLADAGKRESATEGRSVCERLRGLTGITAPAELSHLSSKMWLRHRRAGKRNTGRAGRKEVIAFCFFSLSFFSTVEGPCLSAVSHS